MKRLLAALATMAALILGTAAPAQAISFNLAPCFTATFSELNVDSSSGRLVLSGQAIQCAPVVSSGGFRIATYDPGYDRGLSLGYNARLFPSTEVGDKRDFGVAVGSTSPRTFGVCFLGAGLHRITCGLGVITPSSTMLYPLSTSDPRVARDVLTTPFDGRTSPPSPDGNPNGNCGTCF